MLILAKLQKLCFYFKFSQNNLNTKYIKQVNGKHKSAYCIVYDNYKNSNCAQKHIKFSSNVNCQMKQRYRN